MTDSGIPDFTGWSLDRLTAQRDHLRSVMDVSAGQADYPQLRAEWQAVCAEITRRQEDDFTADRHADLDAGEPGMMADADYYDRTSGEG